MTDPTRPTDADQPVQGALTVNMTPEQAVYSAAFTQALAVACGLTCFGDDGLECYPPNEASISGAKRWGEAAVRAWHDAHTTPGFERF